MSTKPITIKWGGIMQALFMIAGFLVYAFGAVFAIGETNRRIWMAAWPENQVAKAASAVVLRFPATVVVCLLAVLGVVPLVLGLDQAWKIIS